MNVEWYNGISECIDIIEPIFEDLESSVQSHLEDDGDNCDYGIVFNDDEPCGVIKVFERKDDELGIDEELPFISEMGTTRKVKGAGDALFKAFVKEYGDVFWLKCLDEKAESFWKHESDKHGIECENIGETAWGTAILLFGVELEK